MKREIQIAAILCFVSAAFAQVLPDSSASGTVWEPPILEVVTQLPRSSRPKEMMTTLRVAAMPIILEETALADVENRFGTAVGRRGETWNALAWLCFQGGATDRRWGFWLESSVDAGGLIDGYSLQRLDPNARVDQRCHELGKGGGGIELPVALQLGATEMQVSKVLGKPTGRSGNTLLFEHRHKESIHGEPHTVSSTVFVTLRGGVVWSIQVWKDTVS
jgi:hypothetical protein